MPGPMIMLPTIQQRRTARALRAAQRKTRPEEEISRFKSGDLIVDLTARVVTRAGQK